MTALNDAYRIENPHPDDGDYHEWILDQIPASASIRMVWRDALGRRASSRYRRWLSFRCNNTGCPAKAIVNESHIRAILPPAPPMRTSDGNTI